MARIATFMLSAALAFGAGANGVQTVDDFTLIDHGGEAHRLSYYADAPAVVLFVQGNGCPIVRNVLPDLKAVRDRFEPRGVRFLMLNANLQDTRQAIAEETQEWGIDFDVLHDEAQLVATSLEVERTAEVFVIEPKTMQSVAPTAVVRSSGKACAGHHACLKLLREMGFGGSFSVPPAPKNKRGGGGRRQRARQPLSRTPRRLQTLRHSAGVPPRGRRARPACRHAQPRAATRDRLPSRGAGGRWWRLGLNG